MELLKENGVFNLSEYTITWEELEVLEKGLSLCPSAKMHMFEVFLDLLYPKIIKEKALFY